MKKIFVTIFVMLSFVAFSQTTSVGKKIVLANAVTVTNVAHSHYEIPVPSAVSYSMQWSFSLNAAARTDSTVLTFEGSIDNTTWYNMTICGTPVTSAGANTTITYSSTVASTAINATNTSLTYAGGSMFFFPSFYLTPPYFRATVTHYGTGVVTVTGYLYTKP